MAGPAPDDLVISNVQMGNLQCEFAKLAFRGRLNDANRKAGDVITRFNQCHAAMMAVNYTGSCKDLRDTTANNIKAVFDQAVQEFINHYGPAFSQATGIDCNSLATWEQQVANGNSLAAEMTNRAADLESIYFELARCWDLIRQQCGSGGGYPPPPPPQP